MRERDTGALKGFAFVRFKEASAAEVREAGLSRRRANAPQLAVKYLAGMAVCGRTVGVRRLQANTELFLKG